MADIFELQDKNWKDLPEEEARSKVEDGKYQAMIADVFVKQAKSGLWQMGWKLKLIDNAAIVFMNTPLEGEWLKITKKTVKSCGFDPASMKELKKLINDEAFNSLMVEVTLKTKGDNQNCFINKVVDVLAKTESTKAVNPEELDDIPF